MVSYHVVKSRAFCFEVVAKALEDERTGSIATSWRKVGTIDWTVWRGDVLGIVPFREELDAGEGERDLFIAMVRYTSGPAATPRTS